MVRSPATTRWIAGCAYVGLAACIFLVHILPTDLGPRGTPAPDLLLAVTFVWVLRRPHFLPTLLIAAVFLLADVLLMRAPGLYTALVVLAVEYLRAREAVLRQLPMAAELGTVAAAIVLVQLTHYLVLALFAVPQAALGLTLLQTAATLLVYPLVVAVSRLVFGVRRMSLAEVEAARRLR